MTARPQPCRHPKSKRVTLWTAASHGGAVDYCAVCGALREFDVHEQQHVWRIPLASKRERGGRKR